MSQAFLLEHPEDHMGDLAEALNELVKDEGFLRATCIDLACEFVLKLSKRRLMVVPELDRMQAVAAARTFSIFTQWMRQNPSASHVMRQDETTGWFHLIVSTPTAVYDFSGLGVQEAYAQAAQAMLLRAI